MRDATDGADGADAPAGTGGLDAGAEPSAPPRRRWKLAAGVVALAVLLSGSVWLSLAYDPAVEEARRAGVRVDWIEASFAADTFTTTYITHVSARPEVDAGTAWAVDPAHDCGVFTSLGSGATWTHPHEADRAAPELAMFPADRFCPGDEVAHEAVVRVVVTTPTHRCVAEYQDGSAPGRVENPPTRCEVL